MNINIKWLRETLKNVWNYITWIYRVLLLLSKRNTANQNCLYMSRDIFYMISDFCFIVINTKFQSSFCFRILKHFIFLICRWVIFVRWAKRYRHIGASTKWLPFCKWPIEIHILSRRCFILQSVPDDPVNSNSAMVSMMAWRRKGGMAWYQAMVAKYAVAYMIHLGPVSI